MLQKFARRIFKNLNKDKDNYYEKIFDFYVFKLFTTNYVSSFNWLH